MLLLLIGIQKDVRLIHFYMFRVACIDMMLDRRKKCQQQYLPIERIHVDIPGPLIETPRGNQYVLVVVNQFSKWVECYTLSDQTDEWFASILLSEFIDRNIESPMFKEVCDLLKIVNTRTNPYRLWCSSMFRYLVNNRNNYS